jgi:uncharacterized protein YjbI with pentapeptide repeats
MGSPFDTPHDGLTSSKKAGDQATPAAFPSFHELFVHPKDVAAQILAGSEAGLNAAKHAFVEKMHGAIQFGEEVTNGASQQVAGRDIFSKESIASYAPQTYEQAKPYTYNWYFEQIGAAAPMVLATAIGSRFLGNTAAKSLMSTERVSASSLILDTHNLALRPSPIGLNFANSAKIGFVNEFISPINEPKDGDTRSEALAQRFSNGLHGAASMAAMSAGGVAVESVVGNVGNSLLKKTVVASLGGGLGGVFGTAVDAAKGGQQFSLDNLGQSFVSAALVGGTFGVVSGKPRIESKAHPILDFLNREPSSFLDSNSFARSIAKHVQESESNPDNLFHNKDARGLDLRDFNFGNSKLHRIDFSGADLRGADFSKVRNISEMNFENADLRGAKFSRDSQPSTLEPLTSPIVNAHFDGADLRGADFTNAVMMHSRFRNAKLDSDTNFSGAHLQSINFENANLQGVDFSKARALRESRFVGADVSGTNFSGHSFRYLVFRGVKNIDSAIMDDLNKRTAGPPFADEPAKKDFLKKVVKEQKLDLYDELRLTDRALTLPESAWSLSSEDFIRASRWSVPRHAEASLKGEDPYTSLKPWERAALAVKVPESWSAQSDVRALGRDKFLQDFATTDQQISMFHPKADASMVRLIESGVKKAIYDTNANYSGAIKYLKVSEFEKQVEIYNAKNPHSSGDLYVKELLKVVSNLGDNSSRYLDKVKQVFITEQLEQAKSRLEDPTTSVADAKLLNDTLERLQRSKPELSRFEEYQALRQAADFLTLHNHPVSGKNSLSDWLVKNVTYQRSEPIKDSDDRPLLNENGNQQFSNTIRMRSRADLQKIATNWESIPEADRAQGNFSKLITLIDARRYPNATDANFADEAARGGIKLEDYEAVQARYLKSQTVPSPFPLEKSWQSKDGSLTARFIPRTDARGIFLGNLTDCCQHPNGPGVKAAWYGQEEKNAGFFVVSDSKGNVVAQSLAWVSANKGLVFDSIEGKGLNVGTRGAAVVEAYKAAAQDLASSYSAITVGAGTFAGNGDLVKKSWKPAEQNSQSVPTNLGYTDAQNQYLLVAGTSK